RAECDELISTTAQKLGIYSLITKDYRRELFEHSDGHPYVVKVLLGEVAKSGKAGNIERILSSKEDILDALFERTYLKLSPAAKRVFLTLCHWRSSIARTAVEAVLVRHTNDKMDVSAAIDEVVKSSFIEESFGLGDNTEESVLSVPLAAMVFGRKKLPISQLSSAIEADTAVLRMFGPMRRSSTEESMLPHIEIFFNHIGDLVLGKKMPLDEYLPTILYLARDYPYAWLLLSNLQAKIGGSSGIDQAKDSVRHFLEGASDVEDLRMGWHRLVGLCAKSEDRAGELQAWVELARTDGVQFEVLSSAAQRVNTLVSTGNIGLSYVERMILLRRLREVLSRRIDEGNATDCSRLAWMCLHMRDQKGAAQFVTQGLRLDPNNDYCLRLASQHRW
ncbi:MAG: hypothetical protein ACR2PL_03930, partial [Dehalococcoidia bacterium]